MLNKKDIQLIRGELSKQKDAVLTAVDKKFAKLPSKKYLDHRLERLRKDISLDVGNLLIEGPLKTMADDEKRIDRIEKHLDLPPLE
jgi:hypothetical protein